MIAMDAHATTDRFVPLVSDGVRPSESIFGFMNIQGPVPGSPKPAFKPLAADSSFEPHSTDTCSEPIITLQRNGDIVSAIRIECGCGRVFELNCLY
jgi:hypothetical protein